MSLDTSDRMQITTYYGSQSKGGGGVNLHLSKEFRAPELVGAKDWNKTRVAQYLPAVARLAAGARRCRTIGRPADLRPRNRNPNEPWDGGPLPVNQKARPLPHLACGETAPPDEFHGGPVDLATQG